MKKILLGSIILTLFSISLLFFQLSCQEEVMASPAGAVTQLNKIVYVRYNRALNQKDGIYIANYDGSGQAKINISIPGAPDASLNAPRLSPDGTAVFFQAQFQVNGKSSFNIYSCKIDGSNLKLVLDGEVDQWEYELGGAY